LSVKRVHVNLTDAVRNWLAKHGHDPDYGARPLGRLIQTRIKDKLSDEILFGKLVKGGVVFVDLKNDEIIFSSE
jgi:ATP-dependent Clp protease ATP-binding subunit ClpA